MSYGLPNGLARVGVSESRIGLERATIQVGDAASAALVVGPGDSAKALSLSPQDDFPDVLATSRMIALMEVAAARKMSVLLKPGQLSVGVGVDLRHLAATPIGVEVRAEATFLGMEDKLYRFRVRAFDSGGLIGEGEHTRAIVGAERLVSGALARNERKGYQGPEKR
jgi:fluoroacetyl-CoA thioesterase